jgi:hypothetical protein
MFGLAALVSIVARWRWGHGSWAGAYFPDRGRNGQTLLSSSPGLLLAQADGQIVRGGCFNNNAQNLRAAYRNRNHARNRNNNLGFRCVRDVERRGFRVSLRAGAVTVKAVADGVKQIV